MGNKLRYSDFCRLLLPFSAESESKGKAYMQGQQTVLSRDINKAIKSIIEQVLQTVKKLDQMKKKLFG
jgi:hypothetical protein